MAWRGSGYEASIEFAKAAISVERMMTYGKCGEDEPADSQRENESKKYSS